MKILHLIPSYLPATLASGPIKPTHYLNKALVEKGIEVVVYTMNMDGNKRLDVPLEKEVNIDGVKVYYFPMTFLPWQYSYKFQQALAKNIKNFDLIHITSVFLSVSVLGAYYARKFKKPYIISPHGSLMKEPLKRRSLKKRFYISLFEKRNLESASAIHFLVEQEKEDYLRTSLPLKKAIIIPNGLDLDLISGRLMSPRGSTSQILSSIREEVEPPKIEFRAKFNIASDKKIILFLGRLHQIKGLDTLIPAFAEVIRKEPKAVLVLAGPDDEGYQKEVLKFIDEINLRTSDVPRGSTSQILSEIREEVEPHKIKLHSLILGGRTSNPNKNQYLGSPTSGTSDVPNIIFTGMLIGQDKIAALSESDIFVLPSYTECLSMALIEAMYFSLPAIITRNNGLVEDIIKNNTGIVIDKDEKQLSEAILKILNNPDLAKKMGENGKRLVAEEFNPSKIADKWIEEYNKIINA